MKSTKPLIATAVLTLVAWTAACGHSTKQVSAPTPSSSTIPAADTTPIPAPSPTEKVGIIGGAPLEYKNGLLVSVSAQRFKPSSDASTIPAGQVAVKVRITFNNQGSDTFDAMLMRMHLYYGSLGEKAEMVFDTKAGVDSGFLGTVPHGATRSGWRGYSLPPAGLGQISIEVSPGPEWVSAHFTGSID
jgi:hypothetical protein